MLFLCLRSRFYKHPSPKSDGEWCWVQSSVPASCINPALLDVGFIWELITLWQTRISMEGHKVFWFWWSAKAFVYRHGESFLGGWLHAPLCGKKKNNTLVMWAHLEVWINTPSAAPNIFLWLRPVSPDTSATSTSVASAIFEARH